MHSYHYFTLERRDALAQAMRACIGEPGLSAALARLHSPDYGAPQTTAMNANCRTTR